MELRIPVRINFTTNELTIEKEIFAMNLLGKMPAATSPSGQLNSLDMWKVFRMGLVLIGGEVLTNVPKWMGMQYVYKGVDYTPYVQIALTAGAEMLRRWLAGQPAA